MNAARPLYTFSYAPDASNQERPVQGGAAEDDNIVVARIRAGDAAAYRLLVDRYTPMVFQLTQRFSDTPADADDLAQDIFVKAYRSLEHFGGRSRFSSWLYAIALNCCRDYAKNVRRKIYRLSDSHGAEDAFGRLAEAPDQRLEATEQAQALRNALLHLPESLALPFLLYYNHGFPHRTIATMLGTTEGAVKVRVHRARQTLRKHLDALL